MLDTFTIMMLMFFALVCQHVPKYLLRAAKPSVTADEAAASHHSDTSVTSVSKLQTVASPALPPSAFNTIFVFHRVKDKKKKEAFDLSFTHQEEKMLEDCVTAAESGVHVRDDHMVAVLC